jgi:tetratricopeptide (TPR) repeat protein
MRAPVGQIAFGPFRLDTQAPRLLRDGVEVDLRPQALLALRTLAQNSGNCVNYQDMISEAWRGISVSRHTVAVTVGEVKKALKEYGAWIGYHPRFGYRLEIPQSEDLIRSGWHYWHRHTCEGFEKALCCFQRAAQDNSMDFRAFEGISRCYLMLGTFSMRQPVEMYNAFLESHRRAVELGGLTPELRADRAQGLNVFERRFAEAESDLLEAKRENPGVVGIHIRLAVLYAVWKRFDEALDVLDDAYTADALWPILPSAETMIRCCRGEFDRAIACGKKAVDLHPYMPLGRSHYAQALELAGNYDEALIEYRLACVMSPDLSRLRAEEARCLALTGRTSEARAILAELEQLRAQEYVDAYCMALVLDGLGRRNEALTELERAFAENSCALFILDVDPRMDSLREIPGFTTLRDKVFANVRPRAAATAAGVNPMISSRPIPPRSVLPGAILPNKAKDSSRTSPVTS